MATSMSLRPWARSRTPVSTASARSTSQTVPIGFSLRHPDSRNTGRPFFTLIEPTINSAIQKGFFKQIRFLVQFGADINEKDSQRRTPLMNCALVEEDKWGVGLARILVEKGAAIGHRDTHGLNALQYACIYEREELVKIYLSAVDFNLNQTDKAGNTAMHHAVSAGSLPLILMLIDALNKYKLSGDIPNKSGITPLIQAYKCGHIACAEALISGGHGNEEAKDNVEFKTAKEWKVEALAKMEEHPWTDESSNGNRQPSKDLRKFDLHNLHNGRLRIKSANNIRPPSPWRQGSGRKPHPSSDGEEDASSLCQLPNKDTLANRLYRSASTNELRNKPELVFNVKPIDCFVNGTQNHHSHGKGRGTPGRPFSALSSPPGERTDLPTSWRREMIKLCGSFQFQFTPSFVSSVKPPEVDQACSEDSSSIRPSSAMATESLSGSVSDITSICSRRSGAVYQRRLSMMGKATEAKERRRQSGSLSGKRRVIPSLLTLRVDNDTSSSDGSVASQANRRRNRIESENSEMSKSSGKARLGALISGPDHVDRETPKT